MADYTLPSDSGQNFSSGLDTLLTYVAGEVPIFFPLFLTAFFIIIAMGGYFSQQRTSGTGNFFMWAAIAGYSTTGMALILTIIPGVLPLSILVIVFAISSVATLIFMLTQDR